MSADIVGDRELRELQALDGTGEVLSSLIDIFLDDVEARLQNLTAAAGSADLPAVADLSHLLQGSALTFGAARLAERAGELEAAARSGLAPAAAEVAALRHETEQVIAALTQLRQA